MRSTLDMQTGLLQVPVTNRDHLLGPPDALVTLLQYGDFECPYCGAAHPTLQELIRLRGDVMRFAFRHFPLTNMHPHAEFAAEAGEAAGAQGQFWAMHDWLYEHQQDLQPVAVAAAAERLGLDTAAFAEDLASRRYLPRIREDFVGGLRSGVNGTPTFFVNGVRDDGGYSLDELLAAVDAATG